MIQRIQSLYLFLTTVLAIIFLPGNILVFSNGVNKITMTALNVNRIVEGAGSESIRSLMPYSILLFVVPAISFLAILLYKNRKLQMRLVLLLILLIIATIGSMIYLYSDISAQNNADLKIGVKMFLPVLMLVLAVLSYRGIRKDEALVKSYDRLR